MDYRLRREKLRRKMEESNTDYVILTPGANMTYLSGFKTELHEREFFLVVPQDGEIFFFVNELMEEEVEEIEAVDKIITWEDGEDPEEILAKNLDTETQNIAVEDQMPATFTLELRNIF